jgi:hypothetical protein
MIGQVVPPPSTTHLPVRCEKPPKPQIPPSALLPGTEHNIENHSRHQDTRLSNSSCSVSQLWGTQAGMKGQPQPWRRVLSSDATAGNSWLLLLGTFLQPHRHISIRIKTPDLPNAEVQVDNLDSSCVCSLKLRFSQQSCSSERACGILKLACKC